MARETLCWAASHISPAPASCAIAGAERARSSEQQSRIFEVRMAFLLERSSCCSMGFLGSRGYGSDASYRLNNSLPACERHGALSIHSPRTLHALSAIRSVIEAELGAAV